MKQKKWLIPILALVLLVQMLAPVGLILYHQNLNRNIAEKGEVYRIAVTIDLITEGVVYYNLVNTYYGYPHTSTTYFILNTDKNGVTTLSNPLSEKPLGDKPYIRCVNPNEFPYSCAYETGIESLSYTERYLDPSRTDLYVPELLERQANITQNWYLELAVYQGGYAVRGIYDKDGVPCEQALRALLSA